jgi:hypothetical protein
MMIQGTVMGITALKTTLGDMREGADEEIVKLAQELLQAEEKFEQRLKALL